MALVPVLSMSLRGTTPAQDVSVYIGGRDFSTLLDITATSISDTGTSARSTSNMRLRTTLVAAPEIYDQAIVRVYSSVEDDEVFRGFIRSRHPTTGMNSMLDLIADDIGGLLDDTWIPSEPRPAETLKARIGYLWGKYAGSFLASDMTAVASIGGTLPAQNFAGVTLREAIEATISQASSTATYYVDALGVLHVFTASASSAPYAVVVGTPAGGQIAPEDLDIDFDSNSYANRVYVQGATPAGSGFFVDAIAIAAAGGLIRTATLEAPDCETAAMATSLASMYLGRVSSALVRGRFSASSPYVGWRADQNVTVTEPDMGISAEVFRIANVTTTFQKIPTGYRRRYEVEFGASRTGGVGGQTSSLGGGQVVSGQLGGASNVYVTSDGIAVTDAA